MKKVAYQTGTIELMPYTEQGEFCIVGVFAIDAEIRSLSYKILAPKRTKRLTAFFPEIERSVFTQTLKSVHYEWDRLSEMVNTGGNTRELEIMNNVSGSNLFVAITQPREGMIRHKAKGFTLTDSIDKWLNASFRKMVLRRDLEAVMPEEQKLNKKVAEYINELKFRRYWKEKQVGNDQYHATFPFTYTPEMEQKVERAIKPLYLAQKQSTKIIEYGDTWLQKVRRLNQFKLAPETLVFPVVRPNDQNSEEYEHADLIVKDLKEEGVHDRYCEFQTYFNYRCGIRYSAFF